jgi:hypothetical protein
VEWRIDQRLGDYTDFLGGEWLFEDQFLIYETLDEGPLLIRVGETSVRVAPALFGQPDLSNCDGNVCETSWGVRAQAKDGHYHLLMFPVGVEPETPSLWLYHSETGEVEALPFRYFRQFSPDGQWLILDEAPTLEGYQSTALWARPIDPAGGEARFLFGNVPFHSPYPLWSDGWDKVVVNEPEGRLAAYTFPASEKLGGWQSDGYELMPLAWSPDEGWLAVRGYIPGEPGEVLFVVPTSS